MQGSPNKRLENFYYLIICKIYRFFIVSPSTGEPDIYVSKANVDQDPYPTKYKLTWAAYKDKDYNLTISHWDVESSPGWYYIGVYDDCSSQFSTATYTIRADSMYSSVNYVTYSACLKISLSSEDSDDILVHQNIATNRLITVNAYAVGSDHVYFFAT